MSRIGKNPIPVPDGVTVKIVPGGVDLSGPKGTQNVLIHSEIRVSQEDNQLLVERPSDNRHHRALHGTMRQLLANGVQGVSQGFTVELEIRGIGYSARLMGKGLVLQLGYSHNIYFEPPEGINLKAERTRISVEGIDKQLVGAVAAKIRSFRPPEPYKGKGLRYLGEQVRSKQGKTVGGGEV